MDGHCVSALTGSTGFKLEHTICFPPLPWELRGPFSSLPWSRGEIFMDTPQPHHRGRSQFAQGLNMWNSVSEVLITLWVFMLEQALLWLKMDAGASDGAARAGHGKDPHHLLSSSEKCANSHETEETDHLQFEDWCLYQLNNQSPFNSHVSEVNEASSKTFQLPSLLPSPLLRPQPKLMVSLPGKLQ